MVDVQPSNRGPLLAQAAAGNLSGVCTCSEGRHSNPGDLVSVAAQPPIDVYE